MKEVRRSDSFNEWEVVEEPSPNLPLNISCFSNFFKRKKKEWTILNRDQGRFQVFEEEEEERERHRQEELRHRQERERRRHEEELQRERKAAEAKKWEPAQVKKRLQRNRDLVGQTIFKKAIEYAGLPLETASLEYLSTFKRARIGDQTARAKNSQEVLQLLRDIEVIKKDAKRIPSFLNTDLILLTQEVVMGEVHYVGGEAGDDTRYQESEAESSYPF
ncbi:hypothetical protein [Xanthovirga aplysinae]|uniref:hypothetical protein n=1 Tax=Xanthovirga aplysinae TaxID=2529853 RepID=UPI0012BC19F0|nr:hypothetical protein [Xanthovirga aplysinae]MTI31893.1 hypothetical protein [Xanthovirga aplysinae]